MLPLHSYIGIFIKNASTEKQLIRQKENTKMVYNIQSIIQHPNIWVLKGFSKIYKTFKKKISQKLFYVQCFVVLVTV